MLPFLLPLLSALGTSTLVQGALMGSALSGGIAALTGAKGSDIGKAALGGALTGGLGAGISGLASGQSLAQLFGASNAATAGAGAASASGAITPSQVAANMGVPGIDVSTLPGSQSAMLANQMSGFGPQGLANLSAATEGAVNAGAAANVGGAGGFGGLEGGVGPIQTGGTNLFDNPLKYAMENKTTALASGLAGLTASQQPKKPKKKEPWMGLQWQLPSTYADGGIASVKPRGYDMAVGEQAMYPQPYARGGISDLGTYSDGGRMLKGVGDGMSDSIPGVIANKRPARLADGEFVVPADVVSHLGNGSTDAGAKQLYAMMNKVRKARTGTKKQGRQINPRRFMPA